MVTSLYVQINPKTGYHRSEPVFLQLHYFINVGQPVTGLVDGLPEPQLKSGCVSVQFGSVSVIF